MFRETPWRFFRAANAEGAPGDDAPAKVVG